MGYDHFSQHNNFFVQLGQKINFTFAQQIVEKKKKILNLHKKTKKKKKE